MRISSGCADIVVLVPASAAGGPEDRSGDDPDVLDEVGAGFLHRTFTLFQGVEIR